MFWRKTKKTSSNQKHISTEADLLEALIEDYIAAGAEIGYSRPYDTMCNKMPAIVFKNKFTNDYPARVASQIINYRSQWNKQSLDYPRTFEAHNMFAHLRKGLSEALHNRSITVDITAKYAHEGIEKIRTERMANLVALGQAMTPGFLEVAKALTIKTIEQTYEKIIQDSIITKERATKSIKGDRGQGDFHGASLPTDDAGIFENLEALALNQLNPSSNKS